MKALVTVLTSMALALMAACGTSGSSGSGGASQGPAGSDYGCEGLTGQALERCKVRRDQGSKS